MAPALLMVITIAGVFIGEQAALDALIDELRELFGPLTYGVIVIVFATCDPASIAVAIARNIQTEFGYYRPTSMRPFRDVADLLLHRRKTLEPMDPCPSLSRTFGTVCANHPMDQQE